MEHGRAPMCRKTCRQTVLGRFLALAQVQAFGRGRCVDEVGWVDGVQVAVVGRCCCKVRWCSRHLLLRIGGGEVCDEAIGIEGIVKVG